MARFLQILGLAAGLVGLVVQFCITIPTSMEAGRSLPGSIIFYFSFFTILTNIAAALVHIATLSPAGYAWAPVFASHRVRAGVAVAITAVFVVYLTVLAPLWKPQGLFLFCDVLLHYVAPAIYVLWWLGAGADGRTRWSDISWWMLYPILYVAYVIVRGCFAGEVPYPFLNVAANGLSGVILAIAEVALLFLVLSVAAILADHGFSRFRKPSSRP